MNIQYHKAYAVFDEIFSIKSWIKNYWPGILVITFLAAGLYGTVTTYDSGKAKITIISVDGCQYLVYHDNLIHKGNCNNTNHYEIRNTNVGVTSNSNL